MNLVAIVKAVSLLLTIINQITTVVKHLEAVNRQKEDEREQSELEALLN